MISALLLFLFDNFRQKNDNILFESVKNIGHSAKNHSLKWLDPYPKRDHMPHLRSHAAKNDFKSTK